MNLIRHSENGYDRLEIQEPLQDELMTPELVQAICEGRSLPWAWRDPHDRGLLRFADDFGTRLAYEVRGYDNMLEAFRLRLVP